MRSLDVECIGIHELLKQENAIMIPLKANSDFEKSIDWGVMLAEKLDLSQYDGGRMKRLLKCLDCCIEEEHIDNLLNQNRKEKRMREKQRLAVRMQRMTDDDCNDRLFNSSSEDEEMDPTRSKFWCGEKCQR